VYHVRRRERVEQISFEPRRPGNYIITRAAVRGRLPSREGEKVGKWDSSKLQRAIAEYETGEKVIKANEKTSAEGGGEEARKSGRRGELGGRERRERQREAASDEEKIRADRG